MIKNIIFDLDGTLIKTNQEEFNKKFFESIKDMFQKAGYNGEKLAKASLEAVGAMVLNDGSFTNEKLFWNYFEKKTSIKKETIYELFDDFYNNTYNDLFECVKPISQMNKAIEILNNKGYNLILATNPLFPLVAIKKRASWGNIDCNMFSYITSYENSNYSKPNINYYKELIKNNNLNKDETIMFGNDLIEDLAIEQIGISCFIVKDNMVNLDNIDSCSKKGSYKEMLEYINSLEEVK